MKGSYPVDGNRRRDHLSLGPPTREGRYERPDRDLNGGFRTLDRVVHADALLGQLSGAVAALRRQRAEPLDGFEAEAPPLVLSLSTAAHRPLPAQLAGVRADLRIGAVRRRPDDSLVGAIVTADKGIAKLEQSLLSFRNDPLTPVRQEIPQRAKFEFITGIDARPLDALWTDARPLPTDEARHWWQCWVWKDRRALFSRAAEQLDCPISPTALSFPEHVVVPLQATRHEIVRIVSTIGAIGELRYAKETPHFWTVEDPRSQHDWVADLVGNTSWPGEESPAVCLLDTGVNRGHPLIAPALSPEDLHAVRDKWTGADDALVRQHGTKVAGLALFGDLADALPGTAPVELRHRLESVKLIDADGRDAHDEDSYGIVTQAAIALAEYAAPSRERVVCLTVTDTYSGERPTPWSAALDQSASGVGIAPVAREAHERDWPEPAGEQERRHRLICVSAGNIAACDITGDPDEDVAEHPIESPAQAWNALTIGGVTDKTLIEGTGYAGYQPLADAGERSPFSRASVEWPHAETAIKPELVLEAGNCAMDSGGLIHEDVHSLLLLSTAPHFVTRPLAPMSMTSAATPLAARMGARILARYPMLWPETVRALLVHSARWTPPMRAAIEGAKSKPELRRHLRCFGYGVPDVERALFSFANDLALVTEQTIQPFRRGSSGGALNRAHYFALPWPAPRLQAMGNAEVQIRVTLSYFIEPNIGGRGAVSAAAYRSAGLRFDLKRAGENRDDFFGYVNKLDRAGASLPSRGTDDRRVLGETTISGGSLHSEIWRGPAVDFADRDHLVIYPVSGWWKELKGQHRMESKMRYSLVVSLSTGDESIDLYRDVSEAITAATVSEVEIDG